MTAPHWGAPRTMGERLPGTVTRTLGAATAGTQDVADGGFPNLKASPNRRRRPSWTRRAQMLRAGTSCWWSHFRRGQ